MTTTNTHTGLLRILGQMEKEMSNFDSIEKTAPARIWLDVGEAAFNEEARVFSDLIEVTWSEDNATGSGIEYVRAAPQPPQAPAERVGLTPEAVDLIAADGMRSATGGIYATQVYGFADAVIAEFCRINGIPAPQATQEKTR